MANQKLNTTITIGAVLGTQTARTFGVLKGGLGKINTEIKEVTRRQKEIGRERKALLKAGKSVEHLEAEYRQLENRLKRLTTQQNKWSRAIGKTREAGRKLGQMKTQVVGTFRSGAIAASIYGTAVFGVAKSTAALGDNVAKTADKLGIGTDELQELRYAAERSGVASDGLDKSLEQYIRRLGEAQTGTGPMVDALEALGLEASELTKLPLEKQLEMIADQMLDIEDHATKAALANDLFSRNGVSLINMLKGGSEGLTQLREDARKTGNVMREEATRQSEAFNDALLDAQLSAQGAKNTIGAALLPITTELMGEFSTWVQSNSSQIDTWATNFASFGKTALPILKDVVVGIGTVSSFVWQSTNMVANAVGGWENLGMVIAGAFAAKTILSVGAFVGSVFSAGRALMAVTSAAPLVAGGIRAIGTALVANPIGIAVTAIAGGAYLIYRNWDGISSWFTDKWQQVKGVFTQSWEGIKTGAVAGWSAIKSTLVAYHPDAILYRNWSGISSWFSGKWEQVKGVFSSKWSGLKSMASSWPSDFITLGGNVISGLKDGITAKVEGVLAEIKSVGSRMVATFKSILGINSPSKVFAEFGGWIMDGLKNGIKAKFAELKATISGIADKAASWFKRKLGINSPSRVFMGFGNNVSEGLAMGIRAKGGQVRKSAVQLSNEVTRGYGQTALDATSNPLPGGSVPLAYGPRSQSQGPLGTAQAPATQTQNNTFYIQITPTGDQSPREIVAELQRQVGQAGGADLFDGFSLGIG